MSINQRLRQVRKYFNMQQDDFAKRLGLSQTGVSWLEKEGNAVSEQTIRLLHLDFHVSEEWLRTGEGEMFAAQETLALDDPTLDDLDRAILQSYIKMPPARRAFFKEWVKEMIAVFSQTAAQKEKAAPEISEAEYEKAQAIVDAYRAQKNEYVKKGWPTSTPEEDEAG